MEQPSSGIGGDYVMRCRLVFLDESYFE